MAKIGDVINRDGVEWVLTEDGPVISEKMPWAKNALLGAGAAAESYGLNAGNLLGLVSDERLQQAQEDRQQFQQASSAQNPGAAATGAVALELPTSILGGKGVQAGIGGITGFMQPTDSGIAGRLGNAAIGAGLSVVGDVVGNRAGRVAAAIKDAANPAAWRGAARAAGGDGGGRILSGMANDAESMGYRLTAGMKSGDDTLRTLELGFGDDPATMSWYRDLLEHNKATNSSHIAAAAGISPETMARTGGRIDEEALGEGLNNVRGIYDMVANEMRGGVKVGQPLLDRINKVFDLEKIQDTSTEFKKLSEGILENRDYMELRANLTKAADNERLLPSQVKNIGSLIDTLDMAIDRQLPEGMVEQLSRAREQDRVLRVLMSGQALNPEGFVNPRSAASKMRQAFGDEPYLTGNYVHARPSGTPVPFQPETAKALKSLRIANHTDMAPFVGSSGTGERAAASSFLRDAMRSLKGDKEAIGNIIGKAKLGDLYQYVGENNPQLLLDLVAKNPEAFGKFSRQFGEAYGGAEARDFQRGAE